MKSPLRIMALPCAFLIAAFLFACKHDKGVAATSVKKWDALTMKAVNEAPAPAGGKVTRRGTCRFVRCRAPVLPAPASVAGTGL